MYRIAVDMNLREDHGTIVLPKLSIPGDGLAVGQKVILYESDDIECEAIVRHGETWEWVADIVKGSDLHP